MSANAVDIMPVATAVAMGITVPATLAASTLWVAVVDGAVAAWSPDPMVLADLAPVLAGS